MWKTRLLCLTSVLKPVITAVARNCSAEGAPAQRGSERATRHRSGAFGVMRVGSLAGRSARAPIGYPVRNAADRALRLPDTGGSPLPLHALRRERPRLRSALDAASDARLRLDDARR